MTTHPTQTDAATPRLALDATCDRIVASLTQRLAEAAQQLEHACPHTNHDFLLPVIDPDLASTAQSWSHRTSG